MCNKFGEFFKSKIVKLKKIILDKITTGTVLPPFPDLTHTGALLSQIDPVTPAEVYNLIKNSNSKTSSIDFIPTSLMKRCPNLFSIIITNLANLSFTTGCFPLFFKTAQVIPILKKPNLDKNDIGNFRPISNLINISKILEKLFLSRQLNHLDNSSSFNSHQSGYRKNHSCETSLLFTMINIF